VIASGTYIQGPEHEAFEQELAAYLEVDHCVGTGNGSDALELALHVAARGRSGSVVMAANAGGYAAIAATRAGLQPSYADVDPSTLCLNAMTVEAALDASVLAVVVTHLYGRLADVESIIEVCRPKAIVVVEDCAQAIGARGGGRAAGGLGDMAAFSFYPTKNLGALGDGGAITTSDPDAAVELRRLSQYGWTSRYCIGDGRGRNTRLDELQAAVLRVRLPRVDEWNERRRTIIARYAAATTAADVRFLPAVGDAHAAHLAVAQAQDRDRVRTRLAKAGIETDVHYPIPDYRQPAFTASGDGRSLPHTEDAVASVFTVPCFPALSEAEVAHVCDALGDL
jgi:dTDP-3-amino-2,3,6-trideoxy-4-keto-D-glucose/dTDP-3-amino-3,4,6-trideoxy-alpha-D-glucose/dTDP-2,6-dideoxy-D-kanosamine transaminase